MPGLELNSSKIKLPSSRIIASIRPPATRSDLPQRAASQAEKHLVCHVGVKLCRALVFNNVAEILVLIVVIAFGRLDFDDRQSLAAQHGNREFTPEPTLFDEHLGIKSQRLGQRLPDFVNRCTLELKTPTDEPSPEGFTTMSPPSVSRIS